MEDDQHGTAVPSHRRGIPTLDDAEFILSGLAKLGPRVRVDYGGEYGEEWLRGLVTDLADDGLVEVAEGDGNDDPVARLRR